MNVAVIDYGMGNIGSVSRALEECGARVAVAKDPAGLDRYDRIVLPGVGAFADGMRHLSSKGWVSAIRSAVERSKIPLLGICLGMQLLAERGNEGGDTEGLALIPGQVRRLEPSGDERVPHAGWNEVRTSAASRLFEGVASGTDFYFVHSYHVVPSGPAEVESMTPYAGGFVSAVSRGAAFGVQFHPEKSSKNGFRVLKNFLNLRSC
jgi:glutamine amidotransferase